MQTHPRSMRRPRAAVLPRMIITAIDDGGLGHFDLVADAYAKVAMVMGPLSLDEVGAGDTLRAFMKVDGEEKQIASYVIQNGDLPGSGQGSPIFTLEANASEINRYPDGEYDFSYDVLYSNGRSDGSIEPLPVRIKRTIPGDPEDPSAPVNEALALAEVVPSPVPASATSATVTVPAWTNMAEGDVPTVDWERLHLTLPKITAGGVGQPVSITLTREQLEQVGGMQDLPVSYEIFDVVGNHSGHSRFTLVDVEIEPPDALTAPRIREAVNGMIDPAEQGDTPFTIQIPAIGRRQARSTRNIAPGDTITATFEGRIPGTGASHQWVSPPLTVPGTIFDLTIALPVDEVTPLAGGTARVSYTVRPADEGPTLPSRHLGVAVAGVPALLPPVTIPEDANGDDVLDLKTEIAKGATAVIDYANMALDDYITLDLLGRRANGMADNDRKYRQVSHLGPQSLLIGTEYLTRLDGGTLELKYSADSYDSVTGVQAVRDSEPRNVSIGDPTDEPGLPAPEVVYVANGLLPPATPQTEVIVSRSVLQVGDGVDYHWRSATSDTAHLTVRNLNDDLRFDVAGSLIKANIGSQVSASYTRTRGATVARSEETHFTIAEAIDLPAPTVKEAAANNLLPAAASNGATVKVPASLAPGDSVVVHFDAYDSPQVNWAENLEIVVPPGEVAKVLGKTIDVTYTVNGSQTSAALALHVLSFSEGDAQLPRPLIVEAVDGTIDLTTFEGDATVTLRPWTLIAPGQRIWLSATGTLDDGSPDTLMLLTAYRVTSADTVSGLTTPLPRAWLGGLQEGADLTIKAWATFNQSTDENEAIPFPAATYSVAKMPMPTEDDFESAELGVVARLKRPFMTLTAYFNGMEVTTVESPPYLTGRAIKYTYGQAPTYYLPALTIEFARPVKRVVFDYSLKLYMTCAVIYGDGTNQIAELREGMASVAFEADLGSTIIGLVLSPRHTSTSIQLDHFEIRL